MQYIFYSPDRLNRIKYRCVLRIRTEFVLLLETVFDGKQQLDEDKSRRTRAKQKRALECFNLTISQKLSPSINLELIVSYPLVYYSYLLYIYLLRNSCCRLICAFLDSQ